jgi:hypothetical protein
MKDRDHIKDHRSLAGRFGRFVTLEGVHLRMAVVQG